ncbi:MAG TPA: MazG nucleotide pyrophosphohydrolase domain-containing protein [Candidatus Nanoarchaeia archaeon]
MKEITIKQLTQLVMKQAKEKGFGTEPKETNVPEKIALIHSEISEAYEAYRHKRMKGKNSFEEELGDVLQRILHLCGALNIDIEKAILKKMESNKGRGWDWTKLNETHALPSKKH